MQVRREAELEADRQALFEIGEPGLVADRYAGGADDVQKDGANVVEAQLLRHGKNLLPRLDRALVVAGQHRNLARSARTRTFAGESGASATRATARVEMLVCDVTMATIPGAGRDVRLDLGCVLDIAEGEKPGHDFTERFEVERTDRRGCLRQLEAERGPLGVPLAQRGRARRRSNAPRRRRR